MSDIDTRHRQSSLVSEKLETKSSCKAISSKDLIKSRSHRNLKCGMEKKDVSVAKIKHKILKTKKFNPIIIEDIQIASSPVNRASLTN